MILMSFIAAAVAAFQNDVLGSPVFSSSVYLQRGSGSGPALEYVEYNPSALSFGGPQYTRLAKAPSSFYPTQYSGLSPCVSPCVYEAAVAPAPVPQGAKILTYQAPLSNVVVAPQKIEPKPDQPYQYSYVIYDENTGDQKAQKELSEGGAVRGHYSLVQPNGYVRYVQYTADDINGFNAIVKNFPPKSEIDTLNIQGEEKHEITEEPKPSSELEAASKELGKPEEISEGNENESVGASAEVTTDLTPEKEESKKYILTYEDLINCAQAVFEGADIKRHESHGVPEDNTDHAHDEPKDLVAHTTNEGQEVSASPVPSTPGVPQASYGVPMDSNGYVHDEPGHEGHGHPHQPHPEVTATKKSPLTYIILPSLGGKPC